MSNSETSHLNFTLLLSTILLIDDMMTIAITIMITLSLMCFLVPLFQVYCPRCLTRLFHPALLVVSLEALNFAAHVLLRPVPWNLTSQLCGYMLWALQVALGLS